MSITHSWKTVTFLLCVGLFFVQSFFVYSDYRSTVKQVPFSERAIRGLAVWRSNNCQACHQIYGFGGFLGPDLTNVASRLNRVGFERILTEGQKQMPPFRFDEETRNLLIAFFAELDTTGRGYTVMPASDLVDHLKTALQESDSTGTQAPRISQAVDRLKGYGCLSCHKPFEESIGPDLTLALRRRDRRYVMRNIQIGRGNMPAFPNLRNEEIELLLDGLDYLTQHRERLLALYVEKRKQVSFSFSQLPWYEF